MKVGGRDVALKEEVFYVVGAAMAVSNELGAGFLEAVYQEALGVELTHRAIPYVARPTVRISYKGRVLAKEYIPDVICYGQVIVEVKATTGLTRIDQAQLLNYLKAAGKPVGLLLNFGAPTLEWRRMILSPCAVQSIRSWPDPGEEPRMNANKRE